MIARIHGTLIAKAPDSIVVDVSGVGYELFIPLSTYSSLPRAGSTVTLVTRVFFKDDAIHIYGFSTDLEREFFTLLTTVSGVGPRLARNILSGAAVGDLAGAIASGDSAKLKRLPGVGKKTSERLVLELKDKVAAMGVQASGAPQGKAAPRVVDDVVSALKNLGYRATEAEEAACGAFKDLGPSGDGTPFEPLFKAALKTLTNR